MMDVERVREKKQDLDALKRRSSLSSEQREDLAAIEEDIAEELDLLLDDRALEKQVFLILQESDDVCDCSDELCAAKQGRIPYQVEYADSIEDGLREYERRHYAQNWVSDARDALRQKRIRAETKLDEAIAIATK